MVLYIYLFIVYSIFKRHCFTQKILVVNSGHYKAVLGIHTRKSKIKSQCKELIMSLTTTKKWNVSEARKLTMVKSKVFLFEIYQVPWVLNYERMVMHLFEIYTLYFTIETFIFLYIFHMSCFCN